MKRDISYAIRQIVGNRKHQEDSLLVLDELKLASGQSGTLFLICDGMGGHIAGEIASKLVISIMAQTFGMAEGSIPQKLKFAAKQANAAIAGHIEDNPRLQGMGTTLVAVFICDRLMYWYSVGDSPFWLIRNGQLRRLNEDHSMAGVFGKHSENDASSTDFPYFSGRNFLMSTMNGREPDMVDCPSMPFTLLEKDQLLLATDGIETLRLSRICEILTQTSTSPITQSIDAIFDEIELTKSPYQDNASAILVRIESTENGEEHNGFLASTVRPKILKGSVLTKALLIILILIVILAIFLLQQ